MCDIHGKRAVEAVFQNQPQTLRHLLESRPNTLREAWQGIMTALAATREIAIRDFLAVLCPLMRDRRVRRTLNHPIDADENRVSHWPALYGDTAKLEALREFGADLRVQNRLGTTPLFDAVRGGFPATIKTIARATGPEALSHFNKYDCSPMHWACQQCSLPGAQTLHELDPSLGMQPNSRGALPLDLLEWRKLYQVGEITRSFGRPPHAGELEPYEAIAKWLESNGARHSRAWAALHNEEKLRECNAPFNAELWWTYFRRPTTWCA
jgi:hypothetical protein